MYSTEAMAMRKAGKNRDKNSEIYRWNKFER